MADSPLKYTTIDPEWWLSDKPTNLSIRLKCHLGDAHLYIVALWTWATSRYHTGWITHNGAEAGVDAFQRLYKRRVDPVAVIAAMIETSILKYTGPDEAGPKPDRHLWISGWETKTGANVDYLSHEAERKRRARAAAKAAKMAGQIEAEAGTASGQRPDNSALDGEGEGELKQRTPLAPQGAGEPVLFPSSQSQDPEFQEFLSIWPAEFRVGTELAERYWNGRRKGGETPARILRAAREYIRWSTAAGRQPKDPAHFLGRSGRGYYQDFADNPPPAPPAAAAGQTAGKLPDRESY